MASSWEKEPRYTHPGRDVIRQFTVPFKDTHGQASDKRLEGEGQIQAQRVITLDSGNDSTEEDNEEVIEASSSHVRGSCSPPRRLGRDRHNRDRDSNDRSIGYHNSHGWGQDDRDTHSHIRVSTYNRSPVRDRHADEPTSRRYSGHHSRQYQQSTDRHPDDNHCLHSRSRGPHGPHYRGHKSRHERRRSRQDALAWDASAGQDTSSLLDLSSWLRRIGIFNDDERDKRGSRSNTNTTDRSSSSHARRYQPQHHGRPRQSRWVDGVDDGDSRYNDGYGDDDWDAQSCRQYHDDDDEDWGGDGNEDRTHRRSSRTRSVSISNRREYSDIDQGRLEEHDRGRQAQKDRERDKDRDNDANRERRQRKAISDAARYAAKAGAIAAVHNASMPGSWLGEKGSRVVTAALGAALVDTFVSHNYPNRFNGIRHTAMRQVAERTIKNLTEPIFQRASENRGRSGRGSY